MRLLVAFALLLGAALTVQTLFWLPSLISSSVVQMRKPTAPEVVPCEMVSEGDPTSRAAREFRRRLDALIAKQAGLAAVENRLKAQGFRCERLQAVEKANEETVLCHFSPDSKLKCPRQTFPYVMKWYVEMAEENGRVVLLSAGLTNNS